MARREQHGQVQGGTAGGGLPRSYWLLVGLLAALVVAAYVLLQAPTDRSRVYAAELEYSGHQLALTRQIGWLAGHLVRAIGDRDRQWARDTLLSNARRMEANHRQLLEGDPELGLWGLAGSESRSRYLEGPTALHEQVVNYVARARGLAQAPPDALTADHPAYRYLTGYPQHRLSNGFEKLVDYVQSSQREELARLQLIQGTGIVIGALLVLLLAAGAVGYRLNALRARRAAEEWSQLLLATVDEGILAVDTQGRITMVNPAAASMLGYEPEELEGESLHAAIHHSRADGSEHPWEECPLYRTLEGGEVMRAEDEVLWREDGEPVAVEFVSTPLWRSGEMLGAVMAFKDIRDRKAAERERDRLVAIIEATPDFVGFADRRGRVLYRNPGARQLLLGSPDAELTQDYIWEMRPEWAAKRIREEALPTALERGIWQGETAFLGPDGDEVPVSQILLAHYGEQGEISHISTVARDIRDRKRLEAALRTTAAREETLANAVINALPGIYFLVDEQGRFHRWNAEAEAFTGRDGDWLANAHPTQLLREADRPRALEAMRKGFRDGHATLEAELLTASGETVPFLFSASRIHLDGRPFLNGVAIDISRRREAEERLRFALRCAHAGTWDWDLESGVVEWSDETFRLFGRNPLEEEPPDFDGWLRMVHAEDRERVEGYVGLALDEHWDDFYVEYRVRHPEKGTRWLAQWGRIVYGHEQKPLRVSGLSLDITVRKETERELERLATLDDLTGAYNRRSADSFLKNEINQVQRYGQPLSVVLFDIDHFKVVNDSYGHEQGDTVLKAVVDAASEHLRDADILSRWGGEEFLVLAPKTDLDGAMRLAERMRLAIDQTTSQGEVHVTASFGVAQYRPGEMGSRLLKRADDALYRAKDGGRNRVESAPDSP